MDWDSEDVTREDLIEEIARLEDQNERLKKNNRRLRGLVLERQSDSPLIGQL